MRILIACFHQKVTTEAKGRKNAVYCVFCDDCVSQNGEKLSVTLFQHTEWNEDGEQPSCKSILDLNNDVIRAQISTGNKPIVVVCK